MFLHNLRLVRASEFVIFLLVGLAILLKIFNDVLMYGMGIIEIYAASSRLLHNACKSNWKFVFLKLSAAQL